MQDITIKQFIKENIVDYKIGDKFTVIDNKSRERLKFKAIKSEFDTSIKADNESTTIACLQDRLSSYTLIVIDNFKTVYIGEMTFVEPQQSDYEEIYEQYRVNEIDNTQAKPYFAVIHSIHRTDRVSDHIINEIEKQGDSYIIPDDYSGIIIWDNNRF